MQKITEELKNNTLSHFHLIYGEERYMVRYYKNILVEKLSAPGDEMNCTYFQGNDIKESAIADVGQILPFLAPNRLLIVQDSGFFKRAGEMADYLAEFPDSTYVVFVEREVDKRNRLFKWVDKNGCVTECQVQSEPMLKKWIAGYLKRAGKSIEAPAVEFLIERVGTDMEVLSSEMDKLISYTGERMEIKRADVGDICSGSAVSKIFDMIDAVALGQKERALQLYGDLLENKEPPMSILYLFTRHINILLQMKELSAEGKNKNEIAKKIGIPPFAVPKYGRQAALFKRNRLFKMLSDRADFEENFKNGKIGDQLAVELFLIQALTNC